MSKLHPFYRSFAKLALKKRKQLGINQSDMARRCGLHRSAIHKIETGKCHVLAHNALKMAAILKIPVSELKRISL